MMVTTLLTSSVLVCSCDPITTHPSGQSLTSQSSLSVAVPSDHRFTPGEPRSVVLPLSRN